MSVETVCELSFRNECPNWSGRADQTCSIPNCDGFRGGVEERMIGVYFYFDVSVSLGSWSRHLIIQV